MQMPLRVEPQGHWYYQPKINHAWAGPMPNFPIREELIILRELKKKHKEMIKHIIRRHAPLIADMMFQYALYIFIILPFQNVVCKISISHVINFFSEIKFKW